jgi:hypothetical protein
VPFFERCAFRFDAVAEVAVGVEAEDSHAAQFNSLLPA